MKRRTKIKFWFWRLMGFYDFMINLDDHNYLQIGDEIYLLNVKALHIGEGMMKIKECYPNHR